MRIAVTGATGFIGSHLVEALVRDGHEVTCLARDPERTRSLSSLPVRFVYGSMDSSSALASLVDGQEAVVHAAGLTKARSPEEYIRVNVGGTENLLSVIRGKAGRLRHFVFFSSAEAMGPSTPGQPITEDACLRPFSAYGKSKIMAEQSLAGLERQMPVTIVRPPVVYGPRDKDLGILFRLVARGFLPVVSPSPAFSVVYVKNLVTGICRAIDRAHESGTRSYFFTDGPETSWSDFGGMIARAFGNKPFTLRVPQLIVLAIAMFAGILSALGAKTTILSRDKIREMCGSWVVSDERARRELDYQPAFSTEQGVTETAAWYRSQGWF
ncbi:MAG: NAD-dependent epimerase/dehydratase family protein [Spirochaetia bacterium]